jgi:hypothetical protein
MSGMVVAGKCRAVAPVNILDTEDLPIDPADGGVQVHIVGGGIVPVVEPPASLIYSTLAAAGGGTGFEATSIIPAAALPAALASIYVMLANSVEAPVNPTSYWIQIHLGPAAPLAGAQPLLVGDSLVTPGGNEQFIPPDEISRTTGFVVVASATQFTYTAPVGPPTDILRTRAWGR